MHFYLTRKQSLIAALSILAIFFIAVFVFKPSSKINSTKKAITESIVSGTEFTLDKFVREEIKDGKKLWQIKADKGKYNPLSGRTELLSTEMLLNKKDGGLLELRADKAELLLEGTSGLKKATFSGNVVIVQNKTTTIETEAASYDKLSGLVTSDQPVKIIGDKMILEGVGMEVEVESKEVKILTQTKTIIEPK
jgi:LPS export ABC transporter protein LptC